MRTTCRRSLHVFPQSLTSKLLFATLACFCVPFGGAGGNALVACVAIGLQSSSRGLSILQTKYSGRERGCMPGFHRGVRLCCTRGVVRAVKHCTVTKVAITLALRPRQAGYAMGQFIRYHRWPIVATLTLSGRAYCMLRVSRGRGSISTPPAYVTPHTHTHTRFTNMVRVRYACGYTVYLYSWWGN